MARLGVCRLQHRELGRRNDRLHPPNCPHGVGRQARWRFLLQVARGAGTLVVDVLALTTMQRTSPANLVARVYGVFIALVLAAISLGAAPTPALLAGFGRTGTLLVYGLETPALVLLGYPRLLNVDRLAKQRLREIQPRLRALEASPLFASLGRANLEPVASASTEVDVPVDTLIIRQPDRPTQCTC